MKFGFVKFKDVKEIDQLVSRIKLVAVGAEYLVVTKLDSEGKRGHNKLKEEGRWRIPLRKLVGVGRHLPMQRKDNKAST